MAKKSEIDIQIEAYWFMCQYKLPNGQNVCDRSIFNKMMKSIISQMRAKDKLIKALIENENVKK